jgi:Ribosomal subunit 39S
MQLSGTRILDPMISKSKTWEMLVDNLAKHVGPKPKNIAETLMMKENLGSLPNLKIMKRRETPVDKEKEVGRLKVIQAELLARGLPKLGSSRI